MGEDGYSVLILMNVIMANWDMKNANTRIMTVPEPTGPTDWYIVGDYGASPLSAVRRSAARHRRSPPSFTKRSRGGSGLPRRRAFTSNERPPQPSTWRHAATELAFEKNRNRS